MLLIRCVCVGSTVGRFPAISFPSDINFLGAAWAKPEMLLEFGFLEPLLGHCLAVSEIQQIGQKDAQGSISSLRVRIT